MAAMVAGLAWVSLWLINHNGWALAALPVVWVAIQRDWSVPRLRWLFYGYYPLHLVLLLLIRVPMARAGYLFFRQNRHIASWAGRTGPWTCPRISSNSQAARNKHGEQHQFAFAPHLLRAMKRPVEWRQQRVSEDDDADHQNDVDDAAGELRDFTDPDQRCAARDAGERHDHEGLAFPVGVGGQDNAVRNRRAFLARQGD